MRKLTMAMAVAALAMFAQGARAEDAAKERSEAANATKDQMKQGASDAKSDVKKGAHDAKEATSAQADKAGDKMSQAGSEAKAQASDKKHSLFEGKDNFNVDGKIQSVSKDKLTIARDQLPPATLRISKETKVELDGDAVSASQLKPGADVKASFNLREDKAEAVEIKAKKTDAQKDMHK